MRRRSVLGRLAWGGLVLLGISGGSVQARKPPEILQLGLSFSQESTKLATCGDRIRVYEVPSGKRLREIDSLWATIGWTRQIAFSPRDANLLAVGGDDGSVKLLRLGQAAPVRELRGEEGFLCSLVFSADGQRLAAATSVLENGAFAKGMLRVWDVASGRLIRSIDRPQCSLGAVAFSPDGLRLAFCAGATLEVFETETWEELGSVKLPPGDSQDDPIGLAATFVGDEEHLVVTGAVRKMIWTHAGSRGLLWDVNLNGEAVLRETATENIYSVGATSDGLEYVTAYIGIGLFEPNMDPSLRLQIQRRDPEGRIRWTVRRAPKEDTPGDPYGVSASRDGKWVGWCDGDEVSLLNAETGEGLVTFDASGRPKAQPKTSGSGGTP